MRHNTIFRVLLISLALCCAITAGCAVGKSFEHDKHPFKVMVAPGWMPTRQGAGVIVTPETTTGAQGQGVVIMPGMPPNPEAMTRLTIFHFDEGKPKDLDDFESRMDLKGSDTRYGDVVGRSEGRIAGEKCRIYDIDSRIKMKIRIFFHGGEPYFVSMAAFDNKWDEMLPLMESMAKTVKWTD